MAEDPKAIAVREEHKTNTKKQETNGQEFCQKNTCKFLSGVKPQIFFFCSLLAAQWHGTGMYHSEKPAMNAVSNSHSTRLGPPAPYEPAAQLLCGGFGLFQSKTFRYTNEKVYIDK